MKKKPRKKQVRPYGLFVRIPKALNTSLKVVATEMQITKQDYIFLVLCNAVARHYKENSK